MEIHWPSKGWWKANSTTLIFLALFVCAFLLWWCPLLFTFLSEFLLLVVGLAGVFVPKMLERLSGRVQGLPEPVRFQLFIGLCIVGFLGMVANVIQSVRDDEILTGELTGGDTYCYFTVDTSQGSGSPVTYPVVVWVKGAYPMQNVTAVIQTVSANAEDHLKSVRQLQLGSGELLPGPRAVPDRIGIGRHIIVIESRTRLLNQELNIVESSGRITQFGDVYGDGKKLETISEADTR